MMKQYLIYLTICAASAFEQGPGFFMSRMALTRGRPPSSFRPGVMLPLQRPWHQRFMAPTARMPYVVYRSPTQRFPFKNYKPSTRFYPTWKTTRVPAHSKPEPDFVKPTSEPIDGGAIHTIPAPNLSLSEKPIVVMDTGKQNTPTQAPQQPYEVTESPSDKIVNQVPAKIEHPAGFSKSNSAQITPPDHQPLKNNHGFPLAQGFSHPSLGHPQPYPVEFNHQQWDPQGLQQFHDFQQQALIAQPTTLIQQIAQPFRSPDPFGAQASLIPQQFSLQGNQAQEMLHANQDGFLISPSALYKPDANFIHKLQQQLLQRFPGIELVPFAAQFQSQFGGQPNLGVKPQPFVMKGEDPSKITSLIPTSFVTNEPKNVVQRRTEEGVATFIPPSTINNATEKPFYVTTSTPTTTTTEKIEIRETKPPTTTSTVKYVEPITESQNVTPIYYAQVGQSVGNIEASGFYSSISDVRAATVQTDTPAPKVQENITTSTPSPDLNPNFVQKTDQEKNETVTELKPVLGVSFAKPAKADSVNVAYTLVRADDKELKLAKDGSVYAGQIVEATVSEDHDFNKQKANLISRRAPLRIYTEKKESTTTTAPPKVTMMKSRTPQKSKLTFDDKTGEPVLRIYASYVDSPLQKELLASKSSAVKQVREVARKQDTGDWKIALPMDAVQAANTAGGFDSNQVTNFGLKIQSRSDDFVE